MNELHTSWAGTKAAPVAEASATPSVRVTAPLEFVGASDDTIAEAVRRALTHASLKLRTLEGAGVKVIPEIERSANRPRYRVTLQVSPQARPPEVTRS